MESANPSADAMVRYESRISAYNDFEAMVKLSDLLLYDNRVPKDSPRALQLLERAIKQGRNQRAMYHLALYYRDYGNKLQRRCVIPLLEQALRVRERKRVLFHLASTLYSDKCGPKDPAGAAQLLRRALRLGEDVECMATLAHILLKETCVTGDKQTGLLLYRRAISISNNPVHMNNLGALYTNGTPRLEKSYPRAIKWFKRAIRGGNIVARTNYATVLCQTDSGIEPDCRTAARVLEEVCHMKNEAVLLQLAEIYEQWEELRDFERAFSLYERAIREVRSAKALLRWIDALVYGRVGLAINNAGAVQVCNRFLSFGKLPSIILLSILWNGSAGVPADPQRAFELCQGLDDDKPYLLAAMYRSGAGPIQADREQAKKLCLEPRINPEKLIAGVLLSEEDNVESIQRAEVLLREVSNAVEGHLIWMPLFLRRSKLGLLFHRDASVLPNETKRFEYMDQIAKLNLAVLLLEQEDRGSDARSEAMHIFEMLMKSRLRELAAVNLADVLLRGLAGVEQDRRRAMGILERADEGHMGARVMLVGALFEDCQKRRGRALWEELKEDVSDGEELNRLWRLLPDAVRPQLSADGLRGGGDAGAAC